MFFKLCIYILWSFYFVYEYKIYICHSQIQKGEKGMVKYSSSWDCARQLYRQGGLRNVYRGTMATALRGVIVMTIPYNIITYTQMSLLVEYTSPLMSGY